MEKISKQYGSRLLAIFASLQVLACLTIYAQSTTPNVKVEILGIGAEFLLGGDLTDPENDGLDELGAATDPSWNWKAITASVEPDFEGGENSFNIFDNKVGPTNDKWCCDDPTPDNPVWVDVEFPQAVSLTHFTVTSGNDTPDRDPTDWAIQGSNDGQTYTDIYRFFDTTVPWDDRNQVVKFTLPAASPAYTHIRYIAYDTPGALHQINEIEYFGGAGAVVDTDKDGMPDSWETQYGLNPNDATDAAKDCNNNGVTNLDEFKAGLDPCDATKPTVLSATTTGTFDTARLTFSEDLDPTTATNAANYTISPSLAVTAAAYKGKVVTLTTAKQTPGATAYTVTVKGVKDPSKNEVAAGTTATFYSYLLVKTGVLKFSYWGGITGTPVDGLTSDPRYPATPDLVASVFSFNSRDAFPDDSHENYGATIEGFLTPTESGNYDFFLRSDDASQLFVGTDATEASLVMVAEETGCCDAYHETGNGDPETTQAPIGLVAGKNYFVRLIYKEGGGGDYGQAAWRKTTDTTPAALLQPIPGKFLSSAVDLPAPAEGSFLTQTPAPNAKNVSPITGVTIAHSDGKTEWTAANVTLKFDGAAVNPTVTKEGQVATIVYTPSAILASKSEHTISLGYLDPGGKPATLEWTFVVADYPTLTSAHQALTVDKSKAGFIWNVFQNETFTHTSLKQTEDALAGKLMNGATPVNENLADPAAMGVALGNGVKVGPLLKFEIPTVINMSQLAGEANGNFPDDAQMPGIPGTSGGNDGIDGEVITFVELPAGAITMGVNSDDGFRVQAGYINVPEDGLVLGQFDGGRGAADTLFTFVVATPGIYPFRTIWQEGGGGANIEIFSVKADGTKVLLNDTAKGGFNAYRVGTAPNKPAGPTAAFTSIKVSGGNVIFEWTGAGTLQAGDTVTGPYTDVVNATSPVTAPATGLQKYWRFKP